MPDGRTAWRLRGELAGAERSFVLGHGVNRIGSAESNEVALPVRGVSRHHARLLVDDEGLTLEDLGSRNGTRANGVPVHRALVQAGDRVGLGPVELRLEEVDPDDEALALVLESSATHSAPSVSTTTTGILTPAAPGLATLDSLLGCLGEGGWDGPAAAEVLRGALRAESVAFLEVLDDDVVVLGSAGDVAALGAVEPALTAGVRPEVGRVVVTTLPGAPSGLVALLGRGRSPLVALVAIAPEVETADELLAVSLRLATVLRERRSEAGFAPPPLPRRLLFPSGFVPGRSAAMQTLYAQMQPLLEGDLPVLLLGETGAGKEHLARALHLSSARRRGPFVAVNCAAIPSDLLEAELFGIRKGVATGVSEREGRFQLAAGGTLFLDEIGDTPLPLQAKLLRALQEKEVQPVGGAVEPVDIRVVAATNGDLGRRIADGRFRADLYYRIAGFELRIPPLRERPEDVPALVEEFVRRFARESGRTVRGVSVKAMRTLAAHSWPGNVRELEHEVRRLVYLCSAGRAIDSTMLSERLLDSPAPPATAASGGEFDLESNVADLERRLIQLALGRTRGNQTSAARLLGISRNGLALKMKRYQIEASPARGEAGEHD